VVRQEIHHQEVVVRVVLVVQVVQDRGRLKGMIHHVQVLPVVLHQVRVLPVLQVHPVKLIQKEKVIEKVKEGQETITTAAVVIIIEEEVLLFFNKIIHY
jgi:hypothetical protein